MANRLRSFIARHWLSRESAQRVIVIVFAIVLGLVIFVVYAYVDIVNRVQAQANRTEAAQKASSKLAEARHNDRLRDQRAMAAQQARSDLQIRNIICTEISINPLARKRLIRLLPPAYAKQECRPTRTAAVAPASPSAPSASQKPVSKSTTAPSSAPQASGPTPVARPTAPRSGGTKPPSSTSPTSTTLGGTVGGVLGGACDILNALGLCSQP